MMMAVILCALLGLFQVDVRAQEITEDALEFQRRANRPCLQCHKDPQEKVHGLHGRSFSPNSLDLITCINCHGKTTPQHRNDASDVMNFGADYQPLDQKNGVCMSCHEPKPLREALWSHDVHVSRVTCVSCHQLHPDKDPMRGTTESQRIKLCVDCHGELHRTRQAQRGGSQ